MDYAGKVGLYTPKVAWLTVNRACQMRCKWCYANSAGYNPQDEMSLGLAQKLVLLLKSIGIKTVIIIGGEPTLWKPLLEFNRFCRNKGVKTSLVSNCQRFSSEIFWQDYLKNPNDRVAPSLKAFDHQSQIEIAGTNDLNKVFVGMGRVCKHFDAQINIVYSTLIQGKLLEMVMTAVEIGAKKVRMTIATPSFNEGLWQGTFTPFYQDAVCEITTNIDEIFRLTENNFFLCPNTPYCIWPKSFIETMLKKRKISNGGCQF